MPVIASGALDPNCPSEIDITPVVVNDNGSLRNTLVYLSDGAEKRTPPPPPSSMPVVRMSGCQYQPRLLAVQSQQSVYFDRAGNRTLHNPHRSFASWSGEKGPVKPGPTEKILFVHPNVAERITCDVHKWMFMYVAVLGHPFFAVTGDDGAFRLDAVPGGEYTIATWHESLGEMTQEVRVGPGETSIVSFVYGVGDAR